MDCVYCGSASVTERPEVTARGYRRFRCRGCRRQFNERSGGLLNRTGLPSDGKRVRHRKNAYLNNRLEQDHRGIKGRIRCMCGFKDHDAAACFCREHGELRDLLRSRRHHKQIISASSRRSRFSKGARIALNIMQNV